MAVLALVVAVSGVGGLSTGGAVLWRRQTRIRTELHELQLLVDTESVLKREIARRRWAVIHGGKATVVAVLGGCSALMRSRPAVTAATAGVAAGSMALAMSTTQLSTPMTPEAEVEATGLAPPAVVYRPRDIDTSTTTPNVIAVDGPAPTGPSPESTTTTEPPPAVSIPTTLLPTTTVTVDVTIPATTVPVTDPPLVDPDGRPLDPPGPLDAALAAVTRFPLVPTSPRRPVLAGTG